MTNSPTPNRSDRSKISSANSYGNFSPVKFFPVTLVMRSLCLSMGAIAGVSIGFAIAFERPDLVWQPSWNLFNSQKQQFTLSSEALFEADKANIRSENFRLLDEVAAQLPLSKGHRVRITGHTDLNVAGDELVLSYLRAKAVKEYLARLRGEQSYHWLVVGYGASRPPITRVRKGSNNDNNKSSHRIEIFVDD